MKIHNAVVLVLTLLTFVVARAATITVTSAADSGPETLRHALASAVDSYQISGAYASSSAQHKSLYAAQQTTTKKGKAT